MKACAVEPVSLASKVSMTWIGGECDRPSKATSGRSSVPRSASDECARLQGEVATLHAELQGLRSDVVTGLRAVRSHL
jgi:hypothetical protein